MENINANEMMVEEKFLSELIASNMNVSIFLKNGIKLIGLIKAFDCNTILLSNMGSQLVQRTAICTILSNK